MTILGYVLSKFYNSWYADKGVQVCIGFIKYTVDCSVLTLVCMQTENSLIIKLVSEYKNSVIVW